MAGDWIKLQTVTPDKPEIYIISDELGIDADAVLGKLVRIWVWADSHTIDGNAPTVTRSLLNRIANVSGFADALIKSGWLLEKEGGFEFPNFADHNGNTAKQRALSNKRVAKHRNASSVTKPLPEKRREEKNKTPIPPEGDLCQHENIIQTYREILVAAGRPNLVDARYKGSVTERNIKARWKESKKHRTPEFWQTFFRVVLENDFWMGKGDWSGVDLHWLAKRTNFDKVIQLWNELAEKQNG